MLKEKLDIMRNKLDDVYKNFEKNYKLLSKSKLIFEKIPMKGNRIINPKKNNTE